MMVQSSIIIKIMQYISISGIFIFALLSLFIPERKKRVLFLFIVFLFSGILSFSLYSSVLFFLVSLIVISFFVLFYLYVVHIDFYLKEKFLIEEYWSGKNKFVCKVLDLILPIILCLGVGYLFYTYTFDLFTEYKEMGVGSIASLASIVNSLYADYLIPIIILISILFISILWFILILGMSREE